VIVAGDATARFELRQTDPDREETWVLDTFTLLVKLVAAPMIFTNSSDFLEAFDDRWTQSLVVPSVLRNPEE
jgi:hypothetical protein